MLQGEKRRSSSLWILLLAVAMTGLVLAVVCLSGPRDRMQLAEDVLRIGVLAERQTGSYNGIGDVVAICPANYALCDQLLAIGADGFICLSCQVNDTNIVNYCQKFDFVYVPGGIKLIDGRGQLTIVYPFLQYTEGDHNLKLITSSFTLVENIDNQNAHKLFFK